MLRNAPEQIRSRLAAAQPVHCHGRVLEVTGHAVHAVAPGARLGELCELRLPGGGGVLAEVIGFAHQRVILSPLEATTGLSPATEVWPLGRSHRVAVGDGLLGQVLDGLGQPLSGPVPDGPDVELRPAMAVAPDPLARPPIDGVLTTGIRAIDALNALGVGQRVGIFSAAGVGKSTLLGMLAANAEVDVRVVALIGERGREVREFLERGIPAEARSRTIVVAATADRPAMQRVRAAHVATAIAEHFRDRGQNVLLLMDPVTRSARGLREIGLAAGEPPARNGFPSSVFAELPRLLERAGRNARGSITGVYSVLVEGDDMTGPGADEVPSLVDGHLVLSRELAAANHYPAIDVLESRSRLMNHVAAADRRGDPRVPLGRGAQAAGALPRDRAAGPTQRVPPRQRCGNGSGDRRFPAPARIPAAEFRRLLDAGQDLARPEQGGTGWIGNWRNCCASATCGSSPRSGTGVRRSAVSNARPGQRRIATGDCNPRARPAMKNASFPALLRCRPRRSGPRSNSATNCSGHSARRRRTSSAPARLKPRNAVG